ncbi:transmembrane amino acid transporter protein-domain-containing protein [Aspergillus aurantiobrunneus]
MAAQKEDLHDGPHQIEHTYDDVFGKITEEGPNFRNVHPYLTDCVGFIGTVILMMKTQIGLGVLAIPSALDVLGMVPGILCLLAVACITTWSEYVIGTFKLQHREVYSIDDAGGIMFGLPGRVVLSAAFCLYWIFVSGSAILGLSIGLNAVSTHATCTAVFAVVAAIVGFAFSSIRTLGRITWLAWVSLPCILVAVIIVTIAVGVADRPADAPQTDGPWVSDWRVAGNPTFAEAIAADSNLLFAFSGTPGFFSIVSEMRNPEKYTAAILACQAGVTTLRLLPSSGLSRRRHQIISYAFALPGLLGTMAIVTHIPSKFIFVHILRGSHHLNSNTPTHWVTWLSCTFGVTIVAWIIASTIPVFDALVSLIGALLGPVMCIQPMGAMWLYDNWRRGKEQPRKRSFLMVAGTYGSIKGIMDSYSESGGSSAFSCKDNSNSV